MASPGCGRSRKEKLRLWPYPTEESGTEIAARSVERRAGSENKRRLAVKAPATRPEAKEE